MLVKAFVDESGTGGQPRVMLGAVAARATEWHSFNRQWAKLLKREGVEFTHIVAMENRDHPFKDWGLKRTVPLVKEVEPLMERHLDFGMTVALSASDHQDHYRANLSKRARKESCYGLCSRAIIESVVNEAREAFGHDTVVNFVFEDNSNFESARCAFRDLKDHAPAISANLGAIVPGDKKEHAGLMAADMLASILRRLEPKARFRDLPTGSCRTKRARGRFPMYHVPMDQENLLTFCLQADEIAGEKRWEAKKRKAARKVQNGLR